jgi:transcriptional regulator with XRE-family HTH domain
MATVDFTTIPSDAISVPLSEDSTPRPSGPLMHRVRTVRLQQGVSLRTAARNTKVDIRQLRLQEQEETDLRLSDLRKWAQALDVPIAELLVEPESPLSKPVMERARMIRLMKTAAAINENAHSAGLKRMAQNLVNQLVEIMPELAEVSPWHTYGQRRSLEEYGRVVEHSIPDGFFGD